MSDYLNYCLDCGKAIPHYKGRCNKCFNLKDYTKTEDEMKRKDG